MKTQEKSRIFASGQVKESECSCSKCASMCKNSPCLATPNDIVKLIEAGYVGNLRPTTWAAGMAIGAIPFPIEMIQLETKTDGSCVFFKDSLCSIHNTGLKPTAGKISDNHEPTHFEDSGDWLVAREWLPVSDEMAKNIIEAISAYGNNIKQ